MPPYWRRWRWRRRRRPTWYRRRRPRTFIWRRKRRYRRRQPWVRRKLKLSSIKLRQFQPKTIRFCKIKGIKCLFQGSSLRLGNNYWQYPTSFTPEGRPGGGGWGLLALSLSSFYEDYQHLQNIFTASNAGLPLVRILGFNLSFYQHDSVDYVVEIDNCWPMLDTPLKHPNCQPARMLMGKKRIIVPSTQTKPLRKRKKKVRVGPPSQLLNKWYFQKELCNTKLIMIAASACSLTNYFLPFRAKSNNCTNYCLNTNIFKNTDFQHYPLTTGYQPKNNYWLYSSTVPFDQIKTKDQLIFLGNPKTNEPGKPGIVEITNWGNPFYTDYLTGKRETYLSTKGHNDNVWNSQSNIKQYLTPTHSNLVNKVTYNPDRDTGQGNIQYFVDNYRTQGDQGFNKPGDPNRTLDGYPFWISLFGWPDWIKKLAEIHRVDDDYIIVMSSDFFSQKYPFYVFLDEDFVKGKGPYQTPITDKDNQNWYPKFLFQHQSIENIIETGPGINRTQKLYSVEAKMGYTLKVKWGGCPSTLEKVYDPCSQPTWPVPSNFNEGLQVQSPETDPAKYFHTWDVRRGLITETALQRLKKDSDTLQSIPTDTRSKSDVPPVLLQTHQETTDEETTSEEEKETLKTKLLRLRRNQHRLQQQLLRLINSK
nr:MAG: ORF1 [TTV-like mini virus]